MFIIGNGTVITHDNNTVLRDGAVVTAGDSIIDCGTLAQMRSIYDKASFVNAEGGLILPGFIDAHEHIYSMMARGMAVELPKRADLNTILQKLWWKLDAALTNELVYKSAMAAYMELVKNGVTTVIDHHAAYGEIEDSLSAIAAAAEAFSVKSCLCYEVSDRSGRDKMKKAVRENERFIKKTEKSELLTGIMGLHASFTLSDETLLYCAEHGGDAGYHVHVAEGEADQNECLAKHGMRVVERFDKFNILGEKTIAAHCIHVNEKEMQLLRHSDTAVVHNAQSNMNNAAGCPPVIKMMEQNILLGLGTDGYTHDMLESWKTASLLQKHVMNDAAAGGRELFEAMFYNNRKIAGRYFSRETGIIKKGAAADIIIADYKPLTPLTEENAEAHLFFGLAGGNISFTMTQGRIVMKNRQLTALDEEKIIENCRRGAAELWQKLR